MCLLQHFITDAHPHLPVGNDDIYTRTLPALTYKHEYVMHAILALSSSHLALLTGSALPVEALRHRQRALRGLNEAMSQAPGGASDADAMLAACYILTFQSSYMLDGLSDYIMMLRGCGLVTTLMLQQNLHGSFSIDASSHIKYMEAQFGRFPTIDSRIASDGIRSLNLVKPLLRHPVEEVFYQLLVDVLVSVEQSASCAAYVHLTNIMNKFITLPQCEIHHLLDPENQISQVLMAHFLTLLAILSPITSLEATNRFCNVPMAGMLAWVILLPTHLSPGSARWAPPPLRLTEADCEVPVTDADSGRQLQDTRAEVRRLEEALRAERGARQSPSASLHQSSGLVNDLFDSRGFDVTLKAFRWHLAYCTPAFAASIQSDPAFDLEELLDRVADSFDLQFRTKPARVVLPKWPPRRLIEASLEYFSSNGLYSIHPVVDIDALTCLLDASDFDGSGVGTSIADRACLAALTAMITRIRRQEPAFADADPDAYVQAVLSVLPQLMVEHTNVRALEALIILALYIAPLGQPQTAEILLAMAVRILFNLGAHRAGPTYESTAHKHQHQHLRALFWTFYAVDKEMSLRKCQPPMINDADCDLTLPERYVAQSSEHQFFTSELSSKELLYPSDLRLAMLKSRVYHLLYSEQSLSHSRARRLQLIRELDQELNDLKSQFPSACKPDAVVSGNVPDYFIHDLSLRGVNVHLEYYHCLSKIHGASTIGTPVLQSLSPPSTSMELCYQAARSTLIYLRRIRHLIFPETFCLRLHWEDDGEDWLIRFPLPGKKSMYLDEKVHREAVLMGFIGSRIQIPVRRVIGKENVRDPSKRQGREGGYFEPDIDSRTLGLLYNQMAEILLELWKLDFDCIGCLSEDQQSGQYMVDGAPLTLEVNELMRICGTGNRAPSGVYRSSTNYIASLLQLQSIHLREQRSSVYDSEDCWEEYACRHLMKAVALDFISQEENHGPYRLFCDDFGPGNVLVDDSLRVTGVIDWESCYTAPMQFAGTIPSWLLLQRPHRIINEIGAVWFLDITYAKINRRQERLVHSCRTDGIIRGHDLLELLDEFCWGPRSFIAERIHNITTIPQKHKEREGFMRLKIRQLQEYYTELGEETTVEYEEEGFTKQEETFDHGTRCAKLFTPCYSLGH
ncbi:hypothetical protein CNMCM6936_003367 [Aspergillus lentulus]|uniref:Xylanolytic transcriptional activator regulatory domain-containing protein n=1 Tax=Aspergillus lentulus TaxID=293939 RepID=A0AAN6BTV2_ASPLE|nr:hypothetical protein CNMCM6069_003432 [Aspergillus lentulus]KAF4170179.1 hypothetical protein CNMCM6936_003367 [Aspergillus lentulus]KAF4209815.1 hypothetical protein CNMCM8927_005018 [Aspergillus lentulus]